MSERFKAKKPESMRLRVHVQTAAMSLTKVEYHNNLMRTAIQALGAVLGGCQSMHTNGLDEAFAIPTEEAMKLAIRTQQIIRDEINVTSVVDPLGGSYFVERLTWDMEQEIWKVLDEVDQLGGAVKLVEEGWFQQKLADSAYAIFKKIDSGEKISVGVNRYVDENARALDAEIHPYDDQCTQLQIDRLNAVPCQARRRVGPAIARGAQGAGALDRREPAAEDHRARQGEGDAGRDLRRPARGLGGVRGADDRVTAANCSVLRGL